MDIQKISVDTEINYDWGRELRECITKDLSDELNNINKVVNIKLYSKQS